MKYIIQFMIIILLGTISLAKANADCVQCSEILSYANKLDESKVTDIDEQIRLLNVGLELLKKPTVTNSIKKDGGERVVNAILYLMTSSYRYDVHNVAGELVLELYKAHKKIFNKVINELPDLRKKRAKEMLGLAKKVEERGNG